MIHIFRGESDELPKIVGKDVLYHLSTSTSIDSQIASIINNLTLGDHVLMKDSSISIGDMRSVITKAKEYLKSIDDVGVCMLNSSGVNPQQEISITKHISRVDNFTSSQAFILTDLFFKKRDIEIKDLFTDIDTVCKKANLKILRTRPNFINYDESKMVSDEEALTRCNTYSTSSDVTTKRNSLIFKFAVIVVIILLSAWAAYQIRKRVDRLDPNQKKSLT